MAVIEIRKRRHNAPRVEWLTAEIRSNGVVLNRTNDVRTDQMAGYDDPTVCHPLFGGDSGEPRWLRSCSPTHFLSFSASPRKSLKREIGVLGTLERRARLWLIQIPILYDNCCMML